MVRFCQYYTIFKYFTFFSCVIFINHLQYVHDDSRA